MNSRCQFWLSQLSQKRCPMSRLCPCVVLLASFACGCYRTPAEDARADNPPAPKEAPPIVELKFPDEVKLPESAGARVPDKPLELAIYLSVNSKGKVLLAALDQPPNAGGNPIKTLDNHVQVEIYLMRRAKEERLAEQPRPGGKGEPPTALEKEDEPEEGPPAKPLRSVVVFRVDRQAPFEKAYPIWRAAQNAGFSKGQWRALRPGGGEGEISVVITRSRLLDQPAAIAVGQEKSRYVIQVKADDAGKIANLTLREEDDPDVPALPEIEVPGDVKPPPKRDANLPKLTADLGTDVDTLTKKLADLRAKHKAKPVKLVLAIEGKLLQADVIRLIETTVRAGFPDVALELIDPKRR